MGAINILPILLTGKVWLALWRGVESRGWDGTGHFAISQIYNQSLFPDSFGWTNAYFGGMPFPNFYPPLFYWCVAALHHTQLFTFPAAFKLMVIMPVLLIPAAIWALGYSLSGKNRMIATGAALACLPLLTDIRFMGALLAGLDYFSTFQIGLYTQPLGFILLVAWFVVYVKPNSSYWRVVLASFLLALTLLANFFNAVTAGLLILSTVSVDLVRYYRTIDPQQGNRSPKALVSHFVSPMLALLLTSFWTVPMLGQYQYFVTRPYVVETGALFSPALFAWYGLALLGSFIWLRQPTDATWSYLGACLVLGGMIIFASMLAPAWFPLQAPRFLATLTFLLAVPVGYALVAGFCWFANLLGEKGAKKQDFSPRLVPYTSGMTAFLFLILFLTAPPLGWAYTFYPEGERAAIDQVLDFARERQDGRYLVEVINPKIGPAWTEASFDARAITSYLGSQGNETISGVFHEASVNALFTLPVVNAFSNYPDSFGISSILADDLDFVAQPLAEQLKRARFLGVKYLVIRTPAMKERVSKELPALVKHDLGWWSIFEIPGLPEPKVRALTYRPALVLSSFSVKARRRNEMSFIRLAEEQFADNWFDVLLARSAESKIDLLADLDRFGALIIDEFDYINEDMAFERLRQFAQQRPLICLASDDPLFKRIQNHRDSLPLLEIIDRQAEERGETIEALHPSHHYDPSSIRRQWAAIRSFLERSKIASNLGSSNVPGQIDQTSIKLNPDVDGHREPAPLLIGTTFHPNWQRSDGDTIYATTPFYMLTFVDKPVTIHYDRNRLDKAGLWMSAATLTGVSLFAVWAGFLRVGLLCKRVILPR